MALSDDLRKRVVEAVVSGGLSHNSAAKRFEVGIASAVRWVKQFEATGELSPRLLGGDRRSGRIEAHHDYLMGLIRRTPDITLLEIQERLIRNCGEHFFVFRRFGASSTVTASRSKKDRARHGAAAPRRAEETPRMVRGTARSRPRQARLHRRNGRLDQFGAQRRALPARAAVAHRRAARPLQDGYARRRHTPSWARGGEDLLYRPINAALFEEWVENRRFPRFRKVTSLPWTICPPTRGRGSRK